MAARVQIQIEAHDQASAVLRGITSHFGSLGGALTDVSALFGAQAKTAQLSAMALEAVNKNADNADDIIRSLAAAEDEQHAASVRLTEALTSLAIEGLQQVARFAKESYEAWQEYAGAVRDVALASGTTAEEASRLLQVLDDYEITAQDVTVASKAMKEKGLVPTLETLAQLSDQYLAIQDPVEQAQFAHDNLGKSYVKYLNALRQGGPALLENAKAINENLVLTDEQIEKSEKARLAVDAWSDAWQGFKVSIGSAVGEMIVANDEAQRQIDKLQQLDEISGQAGNNYRFLTDEQRALIAQMERGEAMTDFYNQRMQEHTEIIEEAQINYKDLISNIMDYQGEIDRYNETNEEIMAREAELLAQRGELEAQYASMTEWQRKYTSEGKKIPEQIDKINRELGDNEKALAENEKALKKWAAQTVFAFAQARAAADGSISAIEGEILVKAGEALGLFDEKTADTMRNVNEAFDNLDASNAEAVIATLQAQLQELVSTPWVIPISTDTSGVVLPGQTTTDPFGGPTSTSVPSSGGQYFTGGSVYAGRMYTVGEAGAEAFVPATNGRILGHAESLHALTLGAGGGGTNYFYGPVTLELASADAESLLGLR